MMKHILAIFVLFIAVNTVFAQNEYDNTETEEEFVGFDKTKKSRERKDWVKNLRIGGNFGFGINNNSVGVEISPLIGYQVVEDRLELGTGIEYLFVRNGLSDYRDNYYGTNSYGRIYVWEGLFGQVSGMYGRINRTFDSGSKLSAKGGNAFVGGGYSVRLGNHGFMNLGAQISLIENDLYPERVIQPFFNFQYGF